MDLKCINVKGPCEYALSFLADRLTEQGYVKKDFKRCLLERERKYPTGLCLSDSVNVAIPHTETCYVNEDLLVIGIPEEQIFFNRIDEPDEEIPVCIIFLLAIKDADRYLPFLASLTDKFSNKEFLDCLEMRDLKRIENYLNLNVLA